VREAIRLRYQLMPYLYTRMWRASRLNEPVVRPLFYDFPNDGLGLGVEDSFMLGPDILVAPVLEEGALDRQVYLPEHAGGWFDLRDGRHFAGGQTTTIAAPLGRLPVFVRCGAMIPMTEQTDRIDPSRDMQRELVIFGAPEETSEAYLYEDDGDTSDWQGQSRLELRFELRRSDEGLVLSVKMDGSHRPRFDRVSVRQVSFDDRIQVELKGNILEIVQKAQKR